MLIRRSRLVLAFAVLTAGSSFALADDSRKPTNPQSDDELLEFLGSVDPASDTVQPVIDQLEKYGETHRGWLGVRIQPVDDGIAESLQLGTARGALVARLTCVGRISM